MDDAHEILLSSLSSAGISLPAGVSSTRGLTPDALVSICAQFLPLIGGDSPPSLPASLPVPTLERFKVCADAAAAVSSLGYRGDLSFHQFLYPSDEDSYKLVRFMVERLSESSEGRRADDNLANRSNSNSEAVGDSFRGQSGGSADAGLFKSELVESSEKESPCSKKAVKDLSEESKNSDGESFTQRENTYVAELERELASQQVKLSKLRYEVENLRNQEKVLVEKTHAKTLETQNLESKYDLLKAALEMALDDQHSVGFNIKELNEQVEAQRRNLLEVESKCKMSYEESSRSALEQTMEEGKMTPEQSLHSDKPELQESLIRLKEIKQETEDTMSEIRKREVEYAELLAELEKQPKIPSRKSYIQRITEITKNSWKQDADIDQIIKETRELQLESNSIQERLHRTYAVVDETVFRDAKKDPVRRQVYRLLTSIHGSFEQISDKIRATDRARREATEHEAKLAPLSSRSLDIDKLQADLDSIRRENEFLGQQLHHD